METNIVSLVMQYNNHKKDERFWLFINLLDLHFWKKEVDKQLKDFDRFIKKQRKPLSVKNDQTDNLKEDYLDFSKDIPTDSTVSITKGLDS